MKRILFALVLFAGLMQQTADQTAVLLVYPTAYAIHFTGDTKWKVFPSPQSMTPIGYGVDQAAAWTDAAAHLPRS